MRTSVNGRARAVRRSVEQFRRTDGSGACASCGSSAGVSFLQLLQLRDPKIGLRIVADLRVAASEYEVSFFRIGFGINCLLQLRNCLLRLPGFSQEPAELKMVVSNSVRQRSSSLGVNIGLLRVIGAIETDCRTVGKDAGLWLQVGGFGVGGSGLRGFAVIDQAIPCFIRNAR